jgi:hypothetical protein
MRLELPQGLGEQWRGLQIFIGGGTGDWVERQPSALDVLYRGMNTPVMVPVLGPRLGYFTFVSVNEAPVTAHLYQVAITPMTDENGVLLDSEDPAFPGTTLSPSPQGGAYWATSEEASLDASGGVNPVTGIYFNGLSFDPAQQYNANQGAGGDVPAEGYPSVVFDVPSTADPLVMSTVRFHFLRAGWYRITPSLSWDLAPPAPPE